MHRALRFYSDTSVHGLCPFESSLAVSRRKSIHLSTYHQRLGRPESMICVGNARFGVTCPINAITRYVSPTRALAPGEATAEPGQGTIVSGAGGR